jgi:hypothetical protein
MSPRSFGESMLGSRKAIVLKSSSAYRNTLILLSENLGKIEALAGNAHQMRSRGSLLLSHGALISGNFSKREHRYKLSDVQILETPLYWARENFLFFHHVLELCNYFIPWDENMDDMFELMSFLYTHPESLTSGSAQKKFLESFFKKLGMYPEHEHATIESWIQSCINEHPQSQLLQTAGYLKTLESP